MSGKIFLPATIVVACLFAGCAGYTQHQQSSMVDYLYPNGVRVSSVQPPPQFESPVRVGVAFVPQTQVTWSAISALDKIELLKQISEDFRAYEFVESIQVIPSAYLESGGSFANLDQISRLYDIDVVALVAYDQSQFTDSGAASVSYLTLIGAYLVPAERNDTHTLMDAAVYDIASRTLLFRAPGVSHVEGNATPVNISEQRRLDSAVGFSLASEDLVLNLKAALKEFRGARDATTGRPD